MKGLSLSEQMVKAWLAGNKTVTRRLMNPQPLEFSQDGSTRKLNSHGKMVHYSPRYRPGETVYIKETWCRTGAGCTIYKADDQTDQPYWKLLKWRSPRFMPEWASRSHALIVSVRPEQIQSITDEEIAKEGLDVNFHDGNIATGQVHLRDKIRHSTARECFRSLWESLYPGSWERNDWVWRIELEKKS